MQVSPRCYAVTGLGYVPPWTVNAGFIAGDRVTLLIDSGANAAAAATLLGYAKAVRPLNTFAAINTEKHFDHIGGNSYLRDRGIEIYGHALISRSADEFQAEKTEYHGAITHPARRARHEEQVFYHGTELVNPTRPLDAEARLDLGGIHAEILFTPGHTPTNLSVWLAEERVMFCGDALTSLYAPNLEASSPPEWRAWLASLNRMENLRPQRIVCGHGPVIEDIPAAIEAVRREILAALARTP